MNLTLSVVGRAAPSPHRLVLAAILFAIAIPAPAVEIDFRTEILPLLSDRCLSCHGADEGSREGGLRLDLRDEALRGGDSGNAAIVPGDPEASELIRRVRSHDDGDMMPPPERMQTLDAAQIATLASWIAEGAVYEEHWAFQPIVAEPLPDVGLTHPVDAFVAARLAEVGLSPAPEAPSEVLCRRLYLDLIGLPPTPEQVEAFSRDGYEATVDALLASERFGEKWARHWLDVARYSDTNGYEKDLQRDQWIWRDWVIDSFNRDQPYDRFVIEQIAGDLLPGATQEQVIATGFLRNSMINEEGAIIPEQFRKVEMFDRLDCIGKSVLGLSTQCAQCHSHKYDPLSMHDYYAMFASLNDTYEARSWVYDAAGLQRRDEVLAEIAANEARLREARPAWRDELAAFAREVADRTGTWQTLEMNRLESISGLNHPVQESDGSILMIGHTSNDVFFECSPALDGITGLRLEALVHRDLPFDGPGRSGIGGWGIQELELFVAAPGTDAWEKLALTDATADGSKPEWRSEDGKQATGPVSLLIDGKDETQWQADRGKGRRNRSSVAVVRLAEPLHRPAGSRLKVVMRMGDMLGSARFSITRDPAPAAQPIDHDAVLAASLDESQRSESQQAILFDAWRRSLDGHDDIDAAIEQAWSRWPDPLTSVLHLAERDGTKRRTTQLLDRGEWDRPRETIEPGVPGALHPLEPSDEPMRLRFARWLVDRRSPLAARVETNRIWQSIFGIGLVETAEDFGTRAPVPAYRELLDRLAWDFMEQGWSRKGLIRTIVTSETYRRSSVGDPRSLELDPSNRLLSRGPRFRADAEVVRDIAMSVSGLITHRLGGPSVIPPVPQNVLDYNYVYPSYWKPAEGAERYRRTVYGFRKRSMPDPATSVFDAPSADASCARRVRSNTPLAALTGLNETIFVEASRALALRVLREAGPSDEDRIERAYRLCVSRAPNARERQVLHELLSRSRARLADGWLDARQVATGDPAKLPELPHGATPQDAAAWTIAARVLLNLDETMAKN